MGYFLSTLTGARVFETGTVKFKVTTSFSAAPKTDFCSISPDNDHSKKSINSKGEKRNDESMNSVKSEKTNGGFSKFSNDCVTIYL